MAVNATAQSAFDVAVSTTMPRRPLRVALLGFGTVGQSVARILAERPELGERLQLTHVYNRGVSRKRVDWVSGQVDWTEDLDGIFASAPDVLVEVMGGVEPAFTVVKRAMAQGASVVTANKMLLAAHGPELLKLASERGVQLRFEAAVAGGVPLIHGVREGLAGDQLTGVAGILNGTCNYILSRMSATDEDMEPVLADAQRLGYAEADPSADVDGHDAAATRFRSARSGRSAARISATRAGSTPRSGRSPRYTRITMGSTRSSDQHSYPIRRALAGTKA